MGDFGKGPHMTCTIAPQPEMASRSVPASKHCESTSKSSSGSCIGSQTDIVTLSNCAEDICAVEAFHCKCGAQQNKTDSILCTAVLSRSANLGCSCRGRAEGHPWPPELAQTVHEQRRLSLSPDEVSFSWRVLGGFLAFGPSQC